MRKNNIAVVDPRENQGLRLVLLVTYGCCLNCEYCFVNKEAKSMSLEDMLKSVDLLLTSEKKDLQLHFFGGEPLMIPFDLIEKTIIYAERRMKETGKHMDIFVTTNGVPLRKRMIDFFKEHNVVLELSLDGDPNAQNANRPQKVGARDSYSLIIKNIPEIIKSEVVARVSMVASPKTVRRLFENFTHISELGFKDIFIMVACGVPWEREDVEMLKKNLARIEDKYFDDFKSGKIRLLNLDDWFAPFRVNTELAVDIDGTIFSACVGYLVHDEKLKKKMILGNIKNCEIDIDRLNADRLSNNEATRVIYHQNNVLKDLKSNIIAGEAMNAFVVNLAKRLKKSGNEFKGVRIKNSFEKSLDFIVVANTFENDGRILRLRKLISQSPAMAFANGFKFDFSFKNVQSEKSLRFTFNSKGENEFEKTLLSLFEIFKNKNIDTKKIKNIISVVKGKPLTFGLDWVGDDEKSKLKLEFENLDDKSLRKVFSLLGLGEQLDAAAILKQGAVAMSIAFSLGGDIEFKVHFLKKNMAAISNAKFINGFYRKKISDFFGPLENGRKKRNDYFYLISPRYNVKSGFKSLKCYRVYETGSDFSGDDKDLMRRYGDIDGLGISMGNQERKRVELINDICSKEKTRFFPSIIGVDFSRETESSLYFTIG